MTITDPKAFTFVTILPCAFTSWPLSLHCHPNVYERWRTWVVSSGSCKNSSTLFTSSPARNNNNTFQHSTASILHVIFCHMHMYSSSPQTVLLPCPQHSNIQQVFLAIFIPSCTLNMEFVTFTLVSIPKPLDPT
jgi:hypothetical protein